MGAASKKIRAYRLGRKPLIDRLLARGVKQGFAERALQRGLTDEDVRWNDLLGRPPHWIETVFPEEELKRRDEYRLKNPDFKG
jgi:hypothetical protein